ncbi:MAG TPA: methylenetetrahydrofolate reductase [NAD(P)H] [Rhodospirillaceae bacterium]|jgi:methylenetetrahydrofolate reductase (NADPH)|nr:methylenetetrahydrofolate reductase [Alphaproteobacteria bacterium]HBH26275.1 methylenetetrahydrofolate reductase [NAD(P)H] [Rhodospirillaceae bacterium]
MRFSFELFPPKTPQATAALEAALPRLAVLNPALFTVTYGAGGTTKDGTLATAATVAARTGVPVAAHLTYLTTPREALLAYAQDLWGRGVRHILALRGDLPPGRTFADFAGPQYFRSTAQFIAALRDVHDFEISVAAYPEVHPDAADAAEDIETLKAKVAAGAERAVTQFFFDNADYWALVDRARAAGVAVPIVPGLLPVHDFPAMARFAAKCRARVPADLEARLAAEGPAAVLAAQIRDLRAQGAAHAHIYTLNRADIVEQALAKI